MEAEEAKEKGFVNKIIEDKAVSNTFNLSVYDKAPKIEQEPEPKPKNAQIHKVLSRMAEVRRQICE